MLIQLLPNGSHNATDEHAKLENQDLWTKVLIPEEQENIFPPR